MRFTRFQLHNFMAYEKLDVELGPITMILGPNGSGKTTLLKAPEVLRYGKARGITAKDSRVFGRNGERWRMVGTVQKGDTEISVKRTASTCDSSAATLDDLFGDPRVFKALMGCQGFVDMRPKDRIALVNDLLATDTQGLVRKLHSLGASDKILGAVRAGNMRKAHRLATEARRRVQATLEGKIAAAGEPVTVPSVTLRGGAVHKADSLKEGALSRAEEVLLKEAADLRAEIELRAKHKGILDAAEEAQEALRRMESDERPVWTPVHESSRLDLQKQANELRRQMSDETATIDNNTRGAEAIHAVLQRDAGACPTCGLELTDESREKLQLKMRKLVEKVHAAKEERERMLDASKVVQADAKRMDDERMRAERHKGAYNDLRLKVKAAENLMLTAHPDPDGARTEALAERVRTLRSAMATVRGYRASVAAREDARAALEPLENRAETYRETEALVDPAGGDSEGALDRINRALAKLAPRVLPGDNPLHITADWEIVLLGRPWSLGSRSERERAGFCIAATLAAISRVKLLTLDDVEHLDSRNRASLLRLCKTLVDHGALDQVVLAMVPSKLERPNAAPDWVTVVWCEGNAEEAGGSDA